MKKLNVNQYHILRKKIWDDLLASGVVPDEDEDWRAFDMILGHHLPVDWDNQDKDSLLLLHDAQLN
jgi:hypothetical protein